MAWIYLAIAGLLEIGWALGLKQTEGFTKFWPSVLTAGAIVTSLIFLGLAVKTLPIGTSYAIWSGIGIVGTTIFGIIWLNEPLSAVRLLCIGFIVAGIAGLKMSTDA